MKFPKKITFEFSSLLVDKFDEADTIHLSDSIEAVRIALRERFDAKLPVVEISVIDDRDINDFRVRYNKDTFYFHLNFSTDDFILNSIVPSILYAVLAQQHKFKITPNLKNILIYDEKTCDLVGVSMYMFDVELRVPIVAFLKKESSITDIEEIMKKNNAALVMNSNLVSKLFEFGRIGEKIPYAYTKEVASIYSDIFSRSKIFMFLYKLAWIKTSVECEFNLFKYRLLGW